MPDFPTELGGGPADILQHDPALDDFGMLGGSHQIEVGPDGRNIDDRSWMRVAQQEFGNAESFMPFGNRNLPLRSYLFLERRAGMTPPTDLLVVEARNGEDSVFNCPVTGVPLTQRMASGVGLTVPALQRVIRKEAPLGLEPPAWQLYTTKLFDAFAKAGIHDLEVAIGGNTVGVFSSEATAIEKKQFPHTRARLRHLFGLKQLGDPASNGEAVMGLVDNAWKFVKATTHGMARQPRSPWWGSMEKLGLEVQDIDLQLYSPTFNARLEADDAALIGREVDLWGRWQLRDIRRLFPSVGDVIEEFAAQKIDLEFLADRHKLDKRVKDGEWWSVTRSDGKRISFEPGVRKRLR